jgi:hypothetical protein
MVVWVVAVATVLVVSWVVFRWLDDRPDREWWEGPKTVWQRWVEARNDTLTAELKLLKEAVEDQGYAIKLLKRNTDTGAREISGYVQPYTLAWRVGELERQLSPAPVPPQPPKPKPTLADRLAALEAKPAWTYEPPKSVLLRRAGSGPLPPNTVLKGNQAPKKAAKK